MSIDIAELKEFYNSTRGKVAARAIRGKISKLWPDAKGDVVLGVGYANPFLQGFSNAKSKFTASLITVSTRTDVSGLYDENIPSFISADNIWPIESNSVNRVVIVHSLYSDENIEQILKEAWRVLVGQGRVLIIVPNRAGVWARFDNNPFGDMRPYSAGQIQRILQRYNFSPTREDRALFYPPSSSRLVLATAGMWEKIGHNFFNAIGGVNIIEASKQVYAGMPLEGSSKKVNRNKVLVSSGSVATSSTHNSVT